MKIRVASNKGGGDLTHILAINSVCEVHLTNVGADNEAYKVELLSETAEPLGVAGAGEVAQNETKIVKVFGEAAQQIKVTAGANTTALILKMQELTLGRGVLSVGTKEYKGDGATTEFALPDNAPANNHTEVMVMVDYIHHSMAFDEWELNADKTAIVFKRTPYAGADISIRLNKWE